AFKSSRKKSTAASITMDSITIDASTGVVGVKTLVWTIMPQLHSGSVLKGVHRPLKDSGASMDTTLINGRFTKTATVDVCCIILDNTGGMKWDEWRQSSAPAFKRALRERVASVVSSGQVEQAHPPVQQAEEQQVDGVETKAVVLRKALRTMNIEGSVRVDERSGKVSNIDVIKMLCPDASSEDAAHMLTRVLQKEAACGATTLDQTVHGPVDLANRIERIKINGKGNPTPVSDAPTAIEIIWLLPARAAREFRKQSADTIARVLGGDVSLCAEIEQRCARLQSTEEGRAYQSFMTGEAPAEKHNKSLPEWFQYATKEQKSAYVEAEVKKSVVVTEIEMHEMCKTGLVSVGQFAGRDRIEYADRIRDTLRRASRASNLLGAPAQSPEDVVGSTMPIAKPIDNSIDPETGMLIASHKVSASVRGPETSICVEAAKLGISTGERAGQVGKVAKRLYGARYGELANRDIPTRHTTFRGKPFVERAYFSRDADLIQRAIRIVCCPGQVSTP
ncbi:unnamed protein product, partial [Pylaiella littoralis]